MNGSDKGTGEADGTYAYTAHLDTFAADNLPPRDEWPDFRFELPELRYPERLNCGEALLDSQVDRGHGARRAVGAMVGEQPVFATYDALLAQTNRIANVLVNELGLVPGNRVLLRAPNNPMMAACWLAVLKAGLIAVPTMPLLRAKELNQIVVKARVATALCDSALADEISQCLDPSSEHYASGLMRVVLFNGGPSARTAHEATLEALCEKQPTVFANIDTARDDVCMLAFTSGTTGEPKATMHFHRDVMAMCDTFSRYVLKPGPDDVFIGTPPLAFTFGLGGMLCFPLSVGGATFLVERTTPELLLELIGRAGATIVFTAPTFYRHMALLLQAGMRKSAVATLRKSVSAGEALPDATRQLWKSTTGIEMIDGIGGTEVMHIYISAAGGDVRRGAIGKVVPGFDAMIVDDAMQPMPIGEVGRLALKGPTGCRYLSDSRQKEYVKNGWNLPGDAFTMDADGYFFYQARTDDMIVSAGYNIAGPEVESAMLAHHADAECGVVGVPDDARGYLVKAFVVLKEGHSPSHELVIELQTFVKTTVAPYKYPRQIEFVDVLPRTETGKLQRFRLRRKEEATL
ncbi:MAG: AMP-binding protein [Burkholderiaceae bacterium]